LAEAGACGFKIFTYEIPPGREEEFLGLCLEDEADIYRVLELVKEIGLLVSFHAENQRLIDLFEQRIRVTDRKDAAVYTASRPPVVEATRVAQLAQLCKAVDTHVHIAHVSCGQALQVLQSAQTEGLPMAGETCPRYLLFTEEDMAIHGQFAMIKPPLRTKEDQQALWQGLFDGSLAAITTDHRPFTLAEKERALDNIWQAVIGAPGVEALVPFVLTEALSGNIRLEQAVQFISSQPAKLFELYPRKGTIRPGADADLVIYDPKGEGTIDSSCWYTKAQDIDRGYRGRRCLGKVDTSIVNGKNVNNKGAIVAEAGVGSFVRPMRS